MSRKPLYISVGSTITVVIATFGFWVRKRKIEAASSGRVKAVRIDDPEVSLTRQSFKAELKSLLSKHNGDTKKKDIVEVVEKLAAINPVPEDCSSNCLFPGEYLSLSAPPFPGKIERKDNLAQFTLGRLSWNIFQPNNLVCTVKSILNPVFVDNENNDDNANNGTTFQYNFVVDLIIHSSIKSNSKNDLNNNGSSSNLEATMINRGCCRPSPDVNNRMMVTFTSSSLIPKSKNKAMKVLWASKFANAYKKAEQERSYMGRMLQYGLKWFLGLTYPTDDNLQEDEFRFEMKKPMSFYFDVLYLDDDIRITKGSRGTIVVVDRVKERSVTMVG